MGEESRSTLDTVGQDRQDTPARQAIGRPNSLIGKSSGERAARLPNWKLPAFIPKLNGGKEGIAYSAPGPTQTLGCAVANSAPVFSPGRHQPTGHRIGHPCR